MHVVPDRIAPGSISFCGNGSTLRWIGSFQNERSLCSRLYMRLVANPSMRFPFGSTFSSSSTRATVSRISLTNAGSMAFSTMQ